MTQFSCVLIGNESLLIGCGDALRDRGHDIRAVVSRDPDIRAWATGLGLPVEKKIAALSDRFAPDDIDWLFSIANLNVIPEAVLALPARGAINFHDGPLPRYAGLNAPVWALIAGESDYGISWHMIEGGIDEGDLLAQEHFAIAADDTAFSLNSKCYGAAMDSFPRVIDQLEAEAPQRQAQDLSQRSYFARDARPEAAARLNFHRPAAQLSALVRALDFGGYWNPIGCPKLEIAGQVLLVGQAETAGAAQGLPGHVMAVDGESLTVATSEGALNLSRLTTPEGGAVTLADLVRAGETLASPTAEQADSLGAAISATLRAEAHWRRALGTLHPMSMPLAGAGTGAPDWEALRIALPDGLSASQAALAALAWGLNGSGEDFGDIALTTPSVVASEQLAPGYVSGWVPLKIRAGATLSETEAALETARTQSVAGGFARDLVARDPQITWHGTPAIGLGLNGTGPVPGSLATVSLREDRATLYIDRARIGEEEAELLARRLETAFQTALAAAADSLLGALDILPASERRKTLAQWNATARDFDPELTIHAAIEAQVARTPEATALVFEDQVLSYATLNARANAVAARLKQMGVGPGDPVGIYLRRSPELVIGALGILKAGGAYVPLDPAYPADRIAHYISDSRAAVIVTDGAQQTELPNCPAEILQVETLGTQAENVDGGAGGADLAYLIYTSGSTGLPKGVMVEHRNVSNFFAGMDDRIGVPENGTWFAVTSLSFDISVLELFWTLARGFKLVLSGDENRAVVSKGPLAVSDRKIDFNLMYWGNDDGAGPKKYELLLEGAKFADANGFNAVWTPERHFHAFGGPYPNPAVTGAAVAAVTRNIAVRAGSCVAPLHHPARIAEEWAVIDNLTNGRAALGIASGWQPDDFILRPENTPPHNKPAMFATIETLRKLWRGEAVEFPKADGSPHAVITQPRPVSKELPIWVTTAGNPDTWKEAGQIGANVLTHLLGQSIEEVAGKIRLYHAALREAGHDPADFTVTLMLHTYLADTREEAAEIARGPMKDYLRSAAGLIKQYAWAFPAFKKPKGVSNAFDMDLGMLGEEELEAILDFAFERYFEDSGLFGTVADGLARVEQLKRIGVDEVACLIDYGIAPDLVLEGLTPLAQVLKRANAPSEPEADDFSLAAQIIRHNVTHMQCTPSMARMIAMNDEARLALGRVKHLLVGGEALPGDLVEDLRECTGAAILNMYGPTETTIWSTCEAVGPGVRGTVNVGTPIANTGVYVLDAAGRPAPIGVPGELCIGGAGVTRGYWEREELTAERFPADPFAAEIDLTGPQPLRMYRTGDLVRWRMDGKLDFLGRTDHQVKIRGQRIELGEIEAALAAWPGVTAAVVVAREMAPGDLRLVGYVTADRAVDEAAIRAELARHLTEVMVPAHIVTLERFPLTPNKKIDRKALPAPAPTRAPRPRVSAQAPGNAPATPATQPAAGPQAQIAAIWAKILGLNAEEIGVEDNFFALGGHSLLAVQAHREIRTTLERPDLSITDIFRFPTLGGLAEHIGGGTDTPEPETPAADEPARAETMSKRRAMRDRRRMRAG
ncbi:MupA/Atu3671 family FMN-dependent luciferase-like monooxygenase [Pseudodonghicola flavimaris]|uniref:LLM class flavin-dependent oxidoreductase n=1 Tax=Pseudodonghicola flavimaris TaxID=3050036 RepID=A0ABT7F3I6_9RHOB|nr:MupA/Atu3671 family FMN-dependent luciferase-like monooxygenase [Pseudodonghicola flavimaris]MDK3019172.1 LLM class flavin-dependent oxidoreductase [Pseudodonghicola flavimaris]